MEEQFSPTEVEIGNIPQVTPVESPVAQPTQTFSRQESIQIQQDALHKVRAELKGLQK